MDPTIRPLRGRLLAAVAVALLVAVIPAAASADSGCPTPAAYAGAGTVGDPFVIATGANLQRLRDTSADWNDVTVLAADIDMAGCTWTTTIAQENSPTFTGTLDGRGHVVSGLTIALPLTSSTLGAGLIGRLGNLGVVEDIGFTGNVSALATGSGSGIWVGGLVGRAESGSMVRRSFATGTASATNAGGSSGNNYDANAGGLIGLSAATVSQSWASGAATATITSNSATAAGAGGLIGVQSAPGSVADSLARGSASASKNGSAVSPNALAGALVGNRAGGLVVSSYWSSTLWPSGNGAASGGPVGTGATTAALTSYATYGPSGAAWSIADGYSVTTTWSICSAYNGGYPFLSQFATASACPTPAPDPGPSPAPAPTPDPGSGTSGGGSAATPAPSQSGTITPAASTARRPTLRVQAQARRTIPAGRRSVLVDGVRTNGAVAGVRAVCRLNGIALSARRARALCGIRVSRGSTSAARESAVRPVTVTARPRCSVGLTISVRVNAVSTGAKRTTWARSWAVSASPPGACRIAPKFSVTG